MRGKFRREIISLYYSQSVVMPREDQFDVLWAFSVNFSRAKTVDGKRLSLSLVFHRLMVLAEVRSRSSRLNHDHTTNGAELKAKFDEIINYFRKSVFHGKFFLQRKDIVYTIFEEIIKYTTIGYNAVEVFHDIFPEVAVSYLVSTPEYQKLFYPIGATAISWHKDCLNILVSANECIPFGASQVKHLSAAESRIVHEERSSEEIDAAG